MIKPIEKTEWATDTVANGANGTNNKVEQTANHRQYGFTFPEPPGRNHFNYWMNAVHLWREYCVATLDEIGSDFGIDASLSDYTIKTIAFNGGTLLRDKTSAIQNYTVVPAKVIVPASNGSHLVYVDETLGTIETEVWGSAFLDTPNNKAPLYRVQVALGDITTVVDLRSSIRSTTDAGGYITFNPEDDGKIQGGYTNPNTHPAGTPGFFMGKYAGSGNTSEQGVSAVNSDTDYFHYYKGNLEIGPDTLMTGVDRPGDTKVSLNSAMVSRGYLQQAPWLREASRTTYAGLFAEIGTTIGGGDNSTTFNIPGHIPTQPSRTSTATSYVAKGSYPGLIPTCIAVNPETGDVWVGDDSDTIYKSAGGTGTFTATGSYPGGQPTGIWVDPTQGDVWVADSDNSFIYKLSRGTGTFSNVGGFTGTAITDLTGNYLTGELFITTTEDNGRIYRKRGAFTSEIAHTNLGIVSLLGISVNPYNSDIWVIQGNAPRVYRIAGGQGDTILTATPPTGGLLDDIDMNPETGDIWVADKSQGSIYLLRGGVGDWIIWGSFPGTNLTGVAVDQVTGDLWTVDATLDTVYRSTGTVDRVATLSYIKT